MKKSKSINEKKKKYKRVKKYKLNELEIQGSIIYKYTINNTSL